MVKKRPRRKRLDYVLHASEAFLRHRLGARASRLVFLRAIPGLPCLIRCAGILTLGMHGALPAA